MEENKSEEEIFEVITLALIEGWQYKGRQITLDEFITEVLWQ